MSRHERYQPNWDRLGDGELDYTGTVSQPALLEVTIREAFAETRRSGRMPTWGARAMARHLADHLGSEPSAMHHLAVTGGGVISDLLAEAAGLALAPGAPDDVRVCADAVGSYLHQEIRRLRLTLPPDGDVEGDES